MAVSRSIRRWVKLSPLLLPVAALFAGGFLLAVAQSLGYFSPVPVEKGFEAGYAPLLGHTWFYAAFGFSVYVAAVSAGLAVAAGALIGFLIWRLPVTWQKAAVVYKIPLILPHIAVAFLVLILWSQSGFFASVGHALGLLDEPADFPAVLFSGNGLGLIGAYAYKGTAFAILMTYAMLQRLDKRLLTTAAMLGASNTTIFFRVVLPHLRPATHTTFIILFLYAFGAFDIPFLLSESYPGVLSIRAYNLYFKRGLINRPVAMAILVIMFIFSVAFIYAYTRMTARLEHGARKL